MPRPPAALVADVSVAPETQPIPVCRMGYSMSNMSQIDVWSIDLAFGGTFGRGC